MNYQKLEDNKSNLAGVRTCLDGGSIRRLLRDDSGQATVEYALVLLGAAAIAGMLVAWAVSSGSIGQLMSTVVNSVISDATPPVP